MLSPLYMGIEVSTLKLYSGLGPFSIRDLTPLPATFYRYIHHLHWMGIIALKVLPQTHKAPTR